MAPEAVTSPAATGAMPGSPSSAALASIFRCLLVGASYWNPCLQGAGCDAVSAGNGPTGGNDCGNKKRTGLTATQSSWSTLARIASAAGVPVMWKIGLTNACAYVYVRMSVRSSEMQVHIMKEVPALGRVLAAHCSSGAMGMLKLAARFAARQIVVEV